MLIIKNQFQEESLSCRKTGKNLGEREGEILDLQEICDSCSVNHEKIGCDMEQLYNMEVESGISLLDWLYSMDTNVDTDIHDLVMLMLQSSFSEEDNGKKITWKDSDCEEYTIRISLGAWERCVCDKATYFRVRRYFLSELKDVNQFCDFMKTCFIDSLFSDEIEKNMRRIPKFSNFTKEIVKNLSLLNDEAVDIYIKNGKNGKKAMRELAARALDCSGDPSHRDKLKFPFTFNNEDAENCTIITEEITCAPHMKLIRKDSNLRIYFWWQDERVAGGKKVLIGSIGGHPY